MTAANLLPSCENSRPEISMALVSPPCKDSSPAPVEVVSHTLKLKRKKENMRAVEMMIVRRARVVTS